MIYFESGNIFNSPAQIIVNPVNTRGISGAGLAKEYALLFPHAQKIYEKKCKEGMRPGDVLLIASASTLKIIAYLATKDDWRQPSRYEWIEDGLLNLYEKINSLSSYRSVAVPQIGCGLGGPKWRVVLCLILDNAKTSDADTYIVEEKK